MLLLAIVVAGSAVVASSAATSPTGKWVPPPRNLSEKGADAVIPDVEIDSKGNAVVVWAQAKGSSWTVQAVDRPAGGPWSAPRALSQPATHVTSAQVAVAGKYAVAVWVRFDSKRKNLIVQTADHDEKTHRWSAPRSLSKPGQDAQPPKVAVNERGDAVAVWASVGLRGWTVLSAYRPAGGAWQPAVPLQPPSVATAPTTDVVIDGTGRAVAVWAATSDGVRWQVRASARATGGAWSKAVVLSGPDSTGTITPQLALEGNDDATVVWSRSVGNNSVVESATKKAGGGWSSPVQLFSDAFIPTIAVDKRGDGLLAWTSSGQSGLSVVASYRRPGKGWGAPATVASATSGGPPQVALDDRGDGLVVWTRPYRAHSRVQSATVAAGGTSWSAPRWLSGPGADATTPQVALDPPGDGAVVWPRYDGQSFVIQGEGYDGNGPTMIELSIPGDGVVGKRLTFAVAPKDTWTTVRTIRWDFGDGTAASGRATGHAYAKPGRYVARVTATDAFGHTTSAGRLVQIAP